MIDPLSPAAKPIYLQAVRCAAVHRLGDFALSRMDYQIDREFRPDVVAHRLSTEILAAATGPRVYTDRRSASAQAVRFASWWDHFKASYRRRWWMRWRSWEIRYTVREATAVAEVKVEATIAAVFPHAADLPESLGKSYPVVWGKRLP